ncbi:MAG: ParB/RepB/Spo0J family partition protein [Alphaproteobacteria bacterium]|nr:ParB/RepB/Spo0J family partition protein [Alphaproteobacteria bacterium]
MNASNKKFGLGRGIEALLGDDELNFNNIDSDEKITNNTVFKDIDADISETAVDNIIPCQFQPRTAFNDEALQSLSESIKEKGVLQPLLVRKRGLHYEIVAGERRWRAAQKAGLKTVPIIIKELSDQETLEVALIENLQRENLTPIEEAEGFNKLMQEYEYTQDALGKVIGKSRSYIANSLRLLVLPADVKQMLNDGLLTAGHARALVGLSAASEIAKKIVNKGLNVRQTEQLIADIKNKKTKPEKIADRDLLQIIADLERKLSLKVKINAGKNGKGSVTLKYNNPAELSSILDILEQR